MDFRSGVPVSNIHMSTDYKEVSEKRALRRSRYYFFREKTLVPSLQSFQSDPFGVRRWGILTPSSL
jgi:hypothetical protein